MTSRKAVAALPLFGFGFRLNEYLVFGLAAFPVGAASATYDYADPDVPDPDLSDPSRNNDGLVEDETQLIFIDVTPGIAVNFDDIGLRLGIAWRATFVRLDRNRNSSANLIDLKLTGWSFKSFRVGMQWRLHENVAVGLAYRHKSVTDIDEGPGGQVSIVRLDAANAKFVLPARLAGGIRLDFGDFGWAGDLEYGFNSQNDRLSINAFPEGSDSSLPLLNVFDWDDQITIKTGVEYRLAEGRFPVRIGFIYDGKTTNKAFPSGFGTPAAATYTGTVGFGWDTGAFAMNLAYAYRFGKVTVRDDDLGFDPEAPPFAADACPACGGSGDYRFGLNGIHVDFTYDWE